MENKKFNLTLKLRKTNYSLTLDLLLFQFLF